MQRLKLTLDREFARYIRTRDIPGRCISCGKPLAEGDAGHFIPRIHSATRWDERNVNGQCIECNRHKDGNIQGYKKGLIIKYSTGIIEELEILKHSTVKFSRADLTKMLIHFRNKTKQL